MARQKESSLVCLLLVVSLCFPSGYKQTEQEMTKTGEILLKAHVCSVLAACTHAHAGSLDFPF